MNTNSRKYFWIIGFTLLICISTSFFSCKKGGDTKAVITVRDAAGALVSGASVTLWQDTTVSSTTGAHSNLRVTKPTDASGNAEFIFALEAYLNITAVKDNDSALGFVRLEEHKTVSKTVHF
jgi:hypothetical protein